MQAEIWTTREGVPRLTDNMAGYNVETRDGRFGTVDRVSYAGDRLFVSTGRVKKRRYVIPVGAVERIDNDSRSILVAVTTQEIEQSPRNDLQRGFDEEMERKTAEYYAPLLSLGLGGTDDV